MTCSVWALGTLLAAVPLAAQDEPRRLTAGLGIGVANPFHSDFEFNALTWGVSVRAAVSRHMALEVLLTDWRHRDDTVTIDLPITLPDGTIAGRIGRFTQRTQRDTWSAMVNALATGDVGRVTIFGGGGGGLMMHHRRFTQFGRDCTPPTLQGCETFSNRFTGTSIGVQALGGADFALSSRLLAFGQVRFAFPIDDPGSGDASLTAGLRVVLY